MPGRAGRSPVGPAGADPAVTDGAAAVPPPQLTGVAVIAAGQGIALLLLAAVTAVKTAAHPPDRPIFAVLAAVLALLAGGVVGWLGLLVRRVLGGARTPLVVLEVLTLPVAWGLVQSGLWGYALAVGLPSLVLLYLLVSPAGREPFIGR